MASTRAPATHCVHRWAHNEDPEKHGKTRNVRFAGMSLYHWSTVIAVKYPKQKLVVIAGDGIRNSTTTCSEKNRAINALPPGWQYVYVDCDTYGRDLESIEGLRRCHDEMKRTLHDKAKLVVESRRGASMAVAYERIWMPLWGRWDDLTAMLKRKPCDCRQFFTPSQLVTIDDSCRVHRESKSRRDAAYADRMQARRRKEEERRAEQAKTETEDAELWRRHEYNGTRIYWYGTYVRLSSSGYFVETSKGVAVPFGDALKLFRLCKAAKAHASALPEHLIATLPTVGYYRVVEITAAGDAVVGCHHLKYEEMDRCFKDAEQRRLVPTPEQEVQA